MDTFDAASGRFRRLACLCLTAWLAVTLVAGDVAAAPRSSKDSAAAPVVRSRRIAVERFSGGTEAGNARAVVVKELGTKVTFEVVPNELIDEAKADGSPEGYVKLGRELDLLAILRGKFGKDEAGLLLAVTVVSTGDGRSLGMLLFRGDHFAEVRNRVREDLWTELEPLLEQAQKTAPPSPPAAPSPPDPDPQPAADPDRASDPPSDPDRASDPPSDPDPAPDPAPDPDPTPRPEGGCPIAAAELESGLTYRWFNYSGERSGNLVGHRLAGAPYLAIGAAYHPAAHAGCGVLAGLGLRGGYERTLTPDSAIDGMPLALTAFAHHAEIVFELALDRFWFTPYAGYAYRHLQLAGDFVPDARMKMVAVGLGMGLRVGWFLAELDGAGHFVIDAGALESEAWFPNARGSGFVVGGRLGASPVRWFDAYLSVENELYTFDLNTELGGPFPNGVAASSYDQSLRFGLGVRFNVPEHRVASSSR